MLSAKDIAAVKTAIDICNPELMREILCAPGSDYDIKEFITMVAKTVE